jgi:hypothetical protein
MKSWAGTYRILVYFSDKVERRRSRQQPLGREEGREGGDDDDDDMLQ